MQTLPVHASNPSASPRIEEKSTGGSTKTKLLPSLRKITIEDVEKVLANWGSFSPLPSLKEALGSCSTVKVSKGADADSLKFSTSFSESTSATETSRRSKTLLDEVLSWPRSNKEFCFQRFSWPNPSSDEINFCLLLHRYGPVFAVVSARKLGWKIGRPLREILAAVECNETP